VIELIESLIELLISAIEDWQTFVIALIIVGIILLIVWIFGGIL
jgi:hypothetical protein